MVMEMGVNIMEMATEMHEVTGMAMAMAIAIGCQVQGKLSCNS